MRDTNIDPELPVDSIMRQWPATIRAFLDRGMKCPGCPIACFHSVGAACREHHVEPDAFRRELSDAARGKALSAPHPRRA